MYNVLGKKKGWCRYYKCNPPFLFEIKILIYGRESGILKKK